MAFEYKWETCQIPVSAEMEGGHFETSSASEDAQLYVNDRTLVLLIFFPLTAAVNYSPRVVQHRWTWGLGDKGTGGGRWNYKILMTELWRNGNFLNWFWRGAQKQAEDTLRMPEGGDWYWTLCFISFSFPGQVESLPGSLFFYQPCTSTSNLHQMTFCSLVSNFTTITSHLSSLHWSEESLLMGKETFWDLISHRLECIYNISMNNEIAGKINVKFFVFLYL